MSGPEFDPHVWKLVTHNSRYALLRSVKSEELGMVASFAEGEWEHHDRGDYLTMAKAYQILSQVKIDGEFVQAPVIEKEPAYSYTSNPNFGRF